MTSTIDALVTSLIFQPYRCNLPFCREYRRCPKPFGHYVSAAHGVPYWLPAGYFREIDCICVRVTIET